MIALVNANALHIPLAPRSVNCSVFSPPYWCLRDYGIDGQLGLEKTPEEYVMHMVEVCREVKRVLRDDGTVWLNLGDSYANERSWGGKSGQKNYTSDAGGYPRHKVGPGLGNKQLVGIPWRVAFALQADGWWLRAALPWIKRNAMPESADDRPGQAVEYVFLLAKSPRYFFDMDAVRMGFADERMGDLGSYKRVTAVERKANNDRQDLGFLNNGGGWTNGEKNGGRNWRNSDLFFTSLQAILDGGNGMLHDGENPLALAVNTVSYPGAHFATYPPALVEPCIRAGTSEAGVCPKCGKPWERVIEKGEAVPRPDNPNPVNPYSAGSGHTNGHGATTLHKQRATTTKGFIPACSCNAGDPVPALVLDPFNGSGTTGQVARSLGRNYVGLDLSFSYLHQQARERLGLTALEAWVNGRKVEQQEPADLGPLFGF
jgi:DNA modification methylase